MLIGHYAPALVLQRVRPSIPLWTLFVATQAVDVLWDVFILAGVEHARIVPGFTESNSLDLYDMPYSHSVVATLVWAAVFAAGWRLYRGPRAPSEWWVIFVAVESHFVGDLIVHVHDLPLFETHGAKLGFGLWRHRELALLVEGGLFVAAALYWRQSPRNRGRWTTITLSVLTVVLIASFYIPAPPTPALLALTCLATYAASALAIGWSCHVKKRNEDGEQLRR